MNLFSIARPAIGAINPDQWASIAVILGSTTSADGTRVPTYLPTQSVRVQVQDLSSKDLRQLEGLNQQGDMKSIYLFGQWTGIVRQDKRGGDLIQLQDCSIWLVTKVLESWGNNRGWVKVAATRQMDRVMP